MADALAALEVSFRSGLVVFADALDLLQFVGRVDGRVVAQVQLIPRLVRRAHVHDEQHAGRLLLDAHPRLFHRVRHGGRGEVHPVLHLHLRVVGVGSHVERDGEGVRAGSNSAGAIVSAVVCTVVGSIIGDTIVILLFLFYFGFLNTLTDLIYCNVFRIFTGNCSNVATTILTLELRNIE